MGAQNPQRIGIYGGTFDPIHLGHLVIAEDALHFAELDKLFFVPAFSAPLRNSMAGNSASDRLEMVTNAVRQFPRFVVDDFEVQQARRVYSIETIRHFRARFPDAELFFLIGEDQYEKLDQWGSIEELRREVTFLCASRDQSTDTKPSTGEKQAQSVVFLPPRRFDVSATEIRERLLQGLSIRSLVPESVADFLESLHSAAKR